MLSSGSQGGYRRVEASERSLHAGPLVEALFALRGFLPLHRKRFEQRLATALAEAGRLGRGFYLGGFPARRALGESTIINVDPRPIEYRLEHRVAEGGEVYLVRDRFLGAGDWTPLLTPIRLSSTHREVEAIVEAGLDYRQTRFYRDALERAGGPNPVQRNFVALKSPQAVETYFRQAAELCRSIRDDGIRPRGEVVQRSGTSVRASEVRPRWAELGEAEIGVALGPAGEIYRFASGKHRTAAAQALGLTSIPVEVRMVHAKWLERQIAESGLPPIEALLHGVRRAALRR